MERGNLVYVFNDFSDVWIDPGDRSCSASYFYKTSKYFRH